MDIEEFKESHSIIYSAVCIILGILMLPLAIILIFLVVGLLILITFLIIGLLPVLFVLCIVHEIGEWFFMIGDEMLNGPQEQQEIRRNFKLLPNVEAPN